MNPLSGNQLNPKSTGPMMNQVLLKCPGTAAPDSVPQVYAIKRFETSVQN
jgi:hypothetical protein